MPPGHVEAGDAPGRRHERLGILRVDAALDRVAAHFHRPRQNLRQGLALGDADLALHDVDAGDELGDRMLHLHARVHLDEVELAGLVHQELHRSGVGVPGARDRLAQHAGDLRALRVGHRRRRRFFQQLLMPPLDAAFALAQNLHVAVLVGQHLELDVARRADVFLQVDVGRTEGAARLVLRLQEQRGQLLGTVHDAHAAPAAAGRRLQNHRIAHLRGQFQRLLPAS